MHLFIQWPYVLWPMYYVQMSNRSTLYKFTHTNLYKLLYNPHETHIQTTKSEQDFNINKYKYNINDTKLL